MKTSVPQPPRPRPKLTPSTGLAHLINFDEDTPLDESATQRRGSRLPSISTAGLGTVKKSLAIFLLVGVMIAGLTNLFVPFSSSSSKVGIGSLAPMTCNPSLHCPEGSIECVQCNPFDHECPLGEYYENYHSLTGGICTDVHRPKYVNGKLNYEFFTELGIRDKEKRCLETLTRAVGRDYSDRLRFISACPIGYFTCYDGFCGANMFECFDRCTEPYCQGFEIRFSDVACDEDCRFGVTGACAEASSESINLPAVPTDPVCCDVAIDELEPYEDLADCCPEISDTTHFLGPVYPEPSGTLPDPDFRVFVPEIRSPELAEALRIEFNFKEGDALCCCPVHCTCTGDPHCTAFNTRRGSVYSDYGAFSFLQEGDLEIRLHLGPRGIVENVTVFLPGEPQKYRLNVEDAFLNRWQMVSDSGVKTYPPTSDLPSVLTSNFYSNDGDYRPGVISTELLVPKTEVTLAFNGLLLVTIQLKRHLRGDWRRLLTIDPNSFELESYERLRFDVKAKRFLKQADDGCCPSGSALSLTYKDQLDGYADGFCWRPLSDTIRNFFEQKGFVKRQLDVSHPRVLQGADEYLLREKCDEYVFLANSYGAIDDLENILTRCIEDQLDFGVGEIQELIDQLKLSANLCISPADIALGPTFQRELQECEYGLIFEARRRDLPASGWSFVRSIPADRSYCGNAITFSNETAIMFDLDGTITALDLQLHEVRFKEKSHLPDACPKCEPSRTLSKLTTEVLYSCGTVTCFPPTVPTTGNPTPSPASIPPSLPTADPTPNPTSNPTSQPTADPTPIPTSQPTSDATLNPTSQATADPTPNPTSQPTAVPTPIPTSNPTSQPTADPTSNPTATVSSAPTMSFAPTDAPTLQPTDSPNCLGPNVAELNFYASKAQINNLGGICGDGAVVNETCGEIFPPVIQFSKIGTYNGRTIDLTISNTSLYVPAHELPGKAEHLGFVSAGIGAGVDLSFQFTDAADNSPLVMDYLVLSLHNLAKSCTCATCAQCELICEDFEGFRMLSPLNKTKLFLDDNSFLCLIREGTAATSITDLIFEKPYVRDLLTDEQIRSTVTVLLYQSSSFEARLFGLDRVQKITMSGFTPEIPCYEINASNPTLGFADSGSFEVVPSSESTGSTSTGKADFESAAVALFPLSSLTAAAFWLLQLFHQL